MSTDSSIDSPQKKDDFRLPQNVRPLKYNISLEPDLETFTFAGVMHIDLEINTPTNRVVMNAAELDINSALIHQENQTMNSSSVSLDEEAETVTFEFRNPLLPGRATINIEFNGTLNENLCGFYRSKYTLPDGTERYMATTQFEAVDARRAFPCFDEPAQKAVFDLTLIVPKDRTAISNMPVYEEILVGECKKMVVFETTPVMPTYLLAFVVADLEYIETTTKNGTLMRVFATPGNKERCEFALEVSTKALEYFEDYFGIPYPLPKMDLAAIPDFEPGAMENWGLVTFREVALLFDPEQSSKSMKQRIVGIIAHELAHQWFGNLVTMEWWNDLWLNESFATLMGSKATDYLFPEWKEWEQFYVHGTVPGLSLDALETSHPIEADIKNPKDISQLFDAISYSKGASVLRMLEDFLGQDAFRRGVNKYLSRHAHGNAQTEDLWNALESESDKPVGKIMDTWTKQVGFPVVEASMSSREFGSDLLLKQRKFVYPGVHTENNESPWQIPINIEAFSGTWETSTLLTSDKEKIPFIAPDDMWLKLNSGQTGFYRVMYSPPMLEMLYPAIAAMSLSAIDRLGIASDLRALSNACMIPYAQYLEAAENYINETEYTIWVELAAGFSRAATLLRDELYYKDFAEHARKFFMPIAEKMGWDPDSDEDDLAPMLRSLALAGVARYQDKGTIEEAKQRFELLVANPQSVNPDLRNVVCTIAAKNGNIGTHRALLRLYRNAELKEEQLCYLNAMGSFRSKTILQKVLEFSLSKDVRHENSASVIVSVAQNPEGRDLAWEFFKDNHEKLHEIFGQSMFMLARIMEGVISGFTTQEKKEEIEAFFDDHPFPEASMAIAQSLERITVNIAWFDRNRDEVGRWLEEKE